MGAKKSSRLSLLARNNAFGISSPKKRIKMADVRVSNPKRKISTQACGTTVFLIINSHKGDRVSPTNKPKITRKRLNPISSALMNRLGVSRKPDSKILRWRPCFFLISMVSRFALANAISMPAKKMIISQAMMIQIRVLVLIMQIRI